MVTIISSFGLTAFRWENNIVKLWNPSQSESGQNFAWLWKNHPPDLRAHVIIFYTEEEGGNVLEKSSLQKVSLYTTPEAGSIKMSLLIDAIVNVDL